MTEVQDLSDVTICAVDTLQPELAARAIATSSRQCRFGDAILFTDKKIQTDARIVKIHAIKSHADYSKFMFKKLYQHIRTQWVLIVQWDGFVVNPSCWKKDFLNYDYIGARWPGRPDSESVGNGGFTLRSLRLLRLVATEAFPLKDGCNEDELFGLVYRPELESKFGIRFAPTHIADQFSYEGHKPDKPTFGFHGVFNMYRHLNDSQMDAFIAQIGRDTANHSLLCILLFNLYRAGRIKNVDSLYKKMRLRRTASEIASNLTNFGQPPHDVFTFVTQRERWLKRKT
jgi:hypothetical protein